MVRKSKGFRRKTRSLLKSDKRLTISEYMKDFEVGDTVAIKINSSVHRGIPHPRFHGKTGKVIGKRGRAVIISIKDGNKYKNLNVYPVHLKGVKSAS